MKRTHWLWLGLMFGVVSGFAGWKWTHPPALLPESEVERRLQPYHVVPSPRESVFYVTQEDRSYEDLARLPRDPSRLEQWQGVVYVARMEGGEGVQVGPWMLFGDPAGVKHVADALR